MKSRSSRSLLRKNKFAHISNSVLRKFLDFSAGNPKIVTSAQVLEKLMIMDFVQPLLEQSFKGGEILEIGCGSGVHSALLSYVGPVSATELRSTVSWLGDTVDQTRAAVFESLAKSPVDFRYNNGLTIPFDDGIFDLVFHNSVIEHVPDIVAFNREVHRVLKPGGICICVTGTPALCQSRFIKSYLLRFPFIAGYGMFAVALHKYFPESLIAKKLNSRLRSWHFESTTSRLKAIVDQHYDGLDTAASLDDKVIRAMYPSLRHFVREPAYNSILINRLALRHSTTPRSLLLQLIHHFRSSWNDLKFRTTPSTHSQHTKNYRTEIQEWKVENWIKSFNDAGFRVEQVQGYRYQQLLDLTFSDRVNSWLTYHALPAVRVASRLLPTGLASEIIIFARSEEAQGIGSAT